MEVPDQGGAAGEPGPLCAVHKVAEGESGQASYSGSVVSLKASGHREGLVSKAPAITFAFTFCLPQVQEPPGSPSRLISPPTNAFHLRLSRRAARACHRPLRRCLPYSLSAHLPVMAHPHFPHPPHQPSTRLQGL